MAENNHVEPLERALVPPRKFDFLRDNPNWRSLVAAVEESFRDGIPQWLADAEEAGLETPDLQRGSGRAGVRRRLPWRSADGL